jgi:hypothetical protein
VFLEAQAAREIEALLRIRAAVAAVSNAAQLIFQGQSAIALDGPRQQLVAALAAVPDPMRSLPTTYDMGQSRDARQAQEHVLAAVVEVEGALDGARDKLAVANAQSNEAMGAAW